MNRKFLELLLTTAAAKGVDAALELYDADEDGTLEGDLDVMLTDARRVLAERPRPTVSEEAPPHGDDR